MIRRATHLDLPAIEALLLRAKRYTEYCTVKVEFERARKAMRNCISSPQGFAAVADHEGKITGVLLGVTTNYWFSAERYASDMGFYSQRIGDGRRLLKMFKAWADGKHAKLEMAQSTNKRAGTLQKLYAEMGLVRIGALFSGERPISVPMNLRSVR